MKKSLLYLWVFILCFCTGQRTGLIWAQEVTGGSISGTIIETFDNTPLPGVTVTVRGTTLATQSDSTGKYIIENVPSGRHELRFVKPGYERASVADVSVITGQTSTADARIAPEFFEAETFEVVADPESDQGALLLEERQLSVNFSDAIGSEMFSNLGVGDAAEALGKVTGATVADGKYAVVRGLADRYTFTTLNGTELASADPDRKAFQLDLLPTGFIEKIDVAKTFTPDMGGGFAGGAINIVPKTFPDEQSFKLSIGGTYNTQSSFRDDYLVTDRGSTDWLGLDDGTRELSPEVDAQPQLGSQTPFDSSVEDSFGSNWYTPREGNSYMGGNGSLEYGNSHALFAGRFGYLASLSYKNDYKFYDDGEINKYEASFISPDGVNQDVEKTDAKAVTEYTWSALANIGYEINEEHQLGFTVLHVQTAEDEARIIQGRVDDLTEDRPNTFLDQRILHWTERELDYMQLRGGHEFPELKDVKLDWAGALSSTSQDEPDHRVVQFLSNPVSGSYDLGGAFKPQVPVRLWRNIEEKNQNIRADMTIPFPSYTEEENIFKFGGAASRSERDFTQRSIQVDPAGNNPFFDTGNPDDLIDPDNSDTFVYRNFAANTEYHGEQAVDGIYAMTEWWAVDWLKLTGGARFESTEITLDGFNNTLGTPIQSASIESNDILPSLSATFQIRDNLQFRAAWSETVVRPTYREIGQIEVYDISRSRVFIGNPDLEISNSENFDVRLDWFPREGEIVSLSLFHKIIDSPIEQFSIDRNDNQITYVNFSEAEVSGIEFEARVGLDRIWEPLSPLTFGINGAYIYSEVPLTDDQIANRRSFGDTATTRPLYDQPEYVINADLTWDIEHWGTIVTVSGGVVGERLVVVGIASPDEFLAPTPDLNLSIRQQIGENWSIRFSAKNLLDPEFESFQEWPTAGEKVLTSYKKGVSLGLSASYEF